MIVVERQNTPIGHDAASEAFGRAYVREFGTAPSTDERALLLALVWIETAQGRSVQNFSPGNITASERYEGLAWRPPWFELSPASTERERKLNADMRAGKAPRAFRAYETLDAGFVDFVHVLRRDFPEVLAAAKTGDPDHFRVALSQAYSGDYKNAAATKTLSSFQRDFGGTPKAGAGSAAAVVPGSLSSRLVSLPRLQLGSSGNAVELVRAVLEATAVAVDLGKAPRLDRFDVGLEKAVRAYQQITGLEPDGVVGPLTWARIIKTTRVFAETIDAD